MTAKGIDLNATLINTRNYIFFTFIILMNYTISRPSPVDIAVSACLLISPFIRQKITGNNLIYFILIITWTASVFASSINYYNERDVQFELLANFYVAILSFTACYTVATWGRSEFETFLRVYVGAAFIAACLGVIGFVTGNDALTWDGRGKGLQDDPNMFAAFLLPAALAAFYLLKRGGSRLLLSTALTVITLGVMCAFSRIAIVSLFGCSFLYIGLINRRRLVETSLLAFGLILVACALLAILMLTVDGFQAKMMDRLTFAKSYDSGHAGRYGRYALSIPMILDYPLGIGVKQVEKYFPEPMHNLLLGGFLYYGWIGGLSIVAIIILSLKTVASTYIACREPLIILIGFSLVSILLCTFLHETWHWRHLWLFFGIIWGINPANFIGEPPAWDDLPTTEYHASS